MEAPADARKQGITTPVIVHATIGGNPAEINARIKKLNSLYSPKPDFRMLIQNLQEILNAPKTPDYKH